MLERLIHKAEECEKVKRACNKQPAEYLEDDRHLLVILSNDGWDLVDF